MPRGNHSRLMYLRVDGIFPKTLSFQADWIYYREKREGGGRL